MRMLALDVGDKWTGIAISDPLGITARPFKTIDSSALLTSLSSIIVEQKVTTIIVGYPETLRGTESAQTKKVLTIFELIKIKFASIECHLCDERYTSQEAAELKKTRTKEDRLKQHAIAAAFILRTYLDSLYNQKELD